MKMKNYYLLFLLALFSPFAHSQTTEETGKSNIPDGSIFALDEAMLLECYPQAGIKPTGREMPRDTLSHSLKLHFTPNDALKPDYLVVVSNSIYDSLAYEIRTYAEDVHAIYGYGVYVEAVENATSEQLKSLILNYEDNLHGVFFVGNLEECLFEIEEDHHNPEYGYRIWPCDLYYMDLDGIWSDTDNNGVYDTHTGNIDPDVFFGRLSAAGLSSMGSEVQLISRQLRKSHDFWWNSSYNVLADTVLNHIGYSWINHFPATHIVPAMPSGIVDDVRFDSPAYSKQAYITSISHNGYGFTHLAAHSHPLAHRFGMTQAPDSIINVSEIKHTNSCNEAYNLFCCSACNWLGASADGYLGGVYLFDGLKTMAVVGTTKTGGMLKQYLFYSQLPTCNIGEAFVSWFSQHYINYMIIPWELVSWSYGMTILGDPTIRLWHDVSDYCQQNLQLSAYPSTNSSNLVMFKAGQSITVTNNFVIPQGVHVIFDAPSVIFEDGFVCPLGATMETRSEGCVL